MYGLGQAEIQPYPTPSQTEAGFVAENGDAIPDLVALWETYIRRESITGPQPYQTTPIVTSQSPPPPPTPVIYSSPMVQQMGGVPWLPLMMGGAILLLVVALVRS